MKILVIQKKRIGDVLTSTVIFEALKQKYPDSELHYLIYENALPVVENNIFVDKIIVLNEETRKGKLKFLKFLFYIRKQKYSVVVDAYGKPNSVIIGWFSGAKIKIGFDKIYSRVLYSHSLVRNQISFSNATKAIEHRLLLLKPLGIDFSEISPKIYLTDNEIAGAKAVMSGAGLDLNLPIVMISALGSSQGKTYPLAYLATVLDWISEFDIQILLNYLPFQKNEIATLLTFCKPETRIKIFEEFYEQDLRKFLAITSLCKAMIGNEGGATNMSKALNIPTFSIYSPNVKKQDWSYFENQTTILSVHIDDYLVGEEQEIVHEMYETQNISAILNKFKPELFKSKLTDFLKFNLK